MEIGFSRNWADSRVGRSKTSSRHFHTVFETIGPDLEVVSKFATISLQRVQRGGFLAGN